MARLSVGGVVQERVVAGARGYLSQPELPVTFGLGQATTIDWVEIRWPHPGAKFERVVVEGIDKTVRIRQP